MDLSSPCEKQTSSLPVKRQWTTPEIHSLRVEKTEIGGGYYSEIKGNFGCTVYKASAATNHCS